MFTQEQLQTQPIVIGAATAAAGKADSEAMADDEKDKILAQLQMLGYME